MPKASLTNWVRAGRKSEFGKAADGKPAAVVMPEQAEIARMRAVVARLTMERDIAKNPQRTLHGMGCKVRLNQVDGGAGRSR